MFGIIIASTLVQVIGLVILVFIAAVATAKIKVARAERTEAAIAREDDELLSIQREQQRIAEDLAASTAAAARAREEVIEQLKIDDEKSDSYILIMGLNAQEERERVEATGIIDSLAKGSESAYRNLIDWASSLFTSDAAGGQGGGEGEGGSSVPPPLVPGTEAAAPLPDLLSARPSSAPVSQDGAPVGNADPAVPDLLSAR
jgi:hypothetical protein